MRQLHLLFALTAAAALTACGGGGDSDAAPPPPTSSPAPSGDVGTNGTLQASVAAATYADQRRQDAFAAFNAARRGAGAGLLAQSAALDTSASSHAAYLSANGYNTASSAHGETAGLPGYTGVDPFTRMTAAGYDYSFASEVIGEIGSSSTMTDCVGDLLDTIYHAADMLSRETEVGIGFGTGSAAGMCTIDMGSPLAGGGARQIPPSGAVIAYPYNGQTVAHGTFHVDNESPRAPKALVPASTSGTPILVGFRNQDYLVSGAAAITQFSIADSRGNVLPSVILADSSVSGTGVNDDPSLDAGVISGFAVLVPTSPLAAGSYTVTLHATVTGGRALALTTWTFTVGAL